MLMLDDRSGLPKSDDGCAGVAAPGGWCSCAQPLVCCFPSAGRRRCVVMGVIGAGGLIRVCLLGVMCAGLVIRSNCWKRGELDDAPPMLC